VIILDGKKGSGHGSILLKCKIQRTEVREEKMQGENKIPDGLSKE
jgi:hypothetical protein